jgi:hypothetical protein
VVAEPERRRAPFPTLAGLLGGALLAAATATTAVVRADAGPSEADLKAARDLFTDAVKDEDAGHWVEALDKLHRVAAVKLTPGIRYHLALCDEHLGHLAAALDAFNAVQAQARIDGARDVLRLVGKHLADLGPRVPRLTIRVLPADATATVKLDGLALPASSLGTPIAVDPGVHQLEATAAPRTPAAATMTLQERDVTSIDLKLGEPAPGPVAAGGPQAPPAAAIAPAAVPPTAAEASSLAQSTQPESTGGPRTGAILATTGAIALAAGGVVSFVLAGNAVNSGEQQCAAQRGPCDSEKNTVRAWDFTAASAWIGTAALGTLAVVLWTKPQGSTSPGSARLVIGPMSAGVWGQF